MRGPWHSQSAQYNSVIKGADGVTQGEANGMCDMRERVHIEQAADNRFEFVFDGSDKPYAFVSIKRVRCAVRCVL